MSTVALIIELNYCFQQYIIFEHFPLLFLNFARLFLFRLIEISPAFFFSDFRVYAHWPGRGAGLRDVEGCLGPSWGHVGPCWAILGAYYWGYVGHVGLWRAMLGHVEGMLSYVDAMLDQVGALLEACGSHGETMLGNLGPKMG